MKILVVRFRALGDCVLTAWAATALKVEHGAEITWAVESSCAPIVAHPELATIHSFDRLNWKRHRWSPATWQSQLRTYFGLRRMNFDAGFDFQGHGKTALALRLANPKRRYSMPGTDALTKRLNPQFHPRSVHQVDQNLELVSQFCAVTCLEAPIMPPQRAISNNERLVTITTGAGHADKCVPLSIWEEVGQILLSDGYRVVYLGGPRDPVASVAGAENLVGKTSVSESMQWIANSGLHLAADTGSGHIAAAYKVPTVSVFTSNRNAPERYQPFGERISVIRGFDLVDKLTAHQIVHAANTLLTVQ